MGWDLRKDNLGNRKIYPPVIVAARRPQGARTG